MDTFWNNTIYKINVIVMNIAKIAIYNIVKWETVNKSEKKKSDRRVRGSPLPVGRLLRQLP